MDFEIGYIVGLWSGVLLMAAAVLFRIWRPR